MFGLFEKNPNARDRHFMLELAQAASDFGFGISALGKDGSDEIMDRALDMYLKRDPEEANYSASDFFLNAFTGAIGHATIKGNLEPTESFAIFSMTDHFLRGNPKYYTDLANDVMNQWQWVLERMGAIEA